MADDDVQRPTITVTRKPPNLVQGLPQSQPNTQQPASGTGLFDQFMKLVQPGAPQASQPVSTDKLMQPSPDMARVAPTPGVIGKVGAGLLKEFTDLVAAPGRTLADKPQTPGMLSDVDVARQQMQQEGAPAWGFNTAGIIAGGRSPFAKEGEIGSFGGKGARAADLAKLEQAKFMDEAKTPMEDIRQKTWWFKDPAGDWMFEIPDKGSSIKADQIGKATRMQDLFEHNRLYQQYPKLKHTEIAWDPNFQSGEASYSRAQNRITLNPNDSPEQLRSSGLHELSHGISYEENFSQGANYQALKSAARAILREKGEAITPASEDDMAFRLYKHHLGEVHARNVELRKDFSPGELLARSPESTADTPRDQMIIRKGDEVQSVGARAFEKSAPREDYDDTVKSAPKGMEWLEKVISPATRSATAQDAAAAIREASGVAARDKAITMDKLEKYHQTVNAMSDFDRMAFIDYVENRSLGKPLFDPSLQGLADVLRDGVMRRQAKLSAMPSHMLMQFIDDYYPHFWENPAQARNAAHQFAGIGKQGSSASTRARSVPTMADGIAMGLKPLTTNPLEATARYITSMDHFIAKTEVVEAAKTNGTITFPKREQIGASGHPQSGQLPRTDLVPVKGVFDKNGVQGVAPEDWARVYNNYVGQRWGGNFEAQSFFDAMQKASNAVTSFELGLSGFHLFTMANEAFIGELARGFANVAALKPAELVRGLGAIAKAPTAPVRLYRLGKKGADVYLDRSPGSQHTRQLVDLITRAGGRMVGKEHAADYNYSAMGNFWTAFQRGALKKELRESAGRLSNYKDPVGALKEPFSLVGKAMETVAYPLFVKYIPAIKNGAAMSLLSDWLKANPTATYDQQLAMARRIWDSIDNRFGEMVQDNLFWNNSLKQVAQTSMRSFSWNLGTVREIGGGVAGLRRPSQFSISSPDFNPKMGYTLALPIGMGIMGIVYEYLKTGQGPQSVEDTQHPLTGGMVPGFGGRGEVLERAQLPGYMKDVYGWWSDPKAEASNKIATLPKMAWQSLQNEDYQGHLIRNPDAPILSQIGQYFQWVERSLGPISLRTLAKGQKTGSNISSLESMVGVKPAPTYSQDPEGYERGMSKVYTERWKREERSRQRQDRQYEGSDVTRPNVPVTRRPNVTVPRRPQ
jgi:Large polyvalent protein associated domain 23